MYCFFSSHIYLFILFYSEDEQEGTLIHSRLEKSAKTSFFLFYQLHCAKSAKCMWVKKQMERSKQTFQHIAISTEDSDVLKRLLACVHLFLTYMHFALFAQCNCQINATFWFLVIWININRISTVTNIDLYLHVQTTIFLGDSRYRQFWKVKLFKKNKIVLDDFTYILQNIHNKITLLWIVFILNYKCTCKSYNMLVVCTQEFQ